MPFYLLPSLGGDNTLRGYMTDRFHDRNVLALTAESRWAILNRLDGLVFIDAGEAASRIRSLDLKKTSYGLGLHLHSRSATVLGFEAARSHEGWRVMVRLGDAFGTKRRSEETPAVPFAR